MTGLTVIKIIAAFLLSPSFFLLCEPKQWGHFLLNLVIYCFAWLTLLFAGIGVFFWMIGVGHAMWFVRQEALEHQIKRAAEKLASEMKNKEVEAE